MSPREYVLEAAKYALLTGAVIALVYVGNTFTVARVEDNFTFMKPHVDGGQIVLLDSRPVRSGDLQPEDMVCYRHTSPERVSNRVGRILALPGETFQIHDGQLIVDNRIRNTAAIAGISRYNVPPIMVPAGHLLIMFDRPFGTDPQIHRQLVALSEIRGRVLWK